MKAAKFNLKKAFFLISGILFLATTSCTKDEPGSLYSVLDETVDNMPENHKDDVKQYP